MNFKVKITGILNMKVDVDADSPEEAERKFFETLKREGYSFNEKSLDKDKFSYSIAQDKPDKIRVILMEPGKLAKVTELVYSIKELKKVVGGKVEIVYPFSDSVGIAYNADGIFKKLPQNRGIYDGYEDPLEIILGTAFICNCSEKYLDNLSDEQIEKYMKLFKYPERFYRDKGMMIGKKYVPDSNE